MSQAGAAGEPGDLVEIGRYPGFDEANEHALVILATGCGYWLVREEGTFVLWVRAADQEQLLAEIARFEAERPKAPPAEPPPLEHRWTSLFVFAWVLSIYFLLQGAGPAWWTDLGTASAQKILAGEWWRALTALTLHSDLSHFIANLATGLLFAAFLRPVIGTGLCWLGIVLSGMLGNLVNAWSYGNHLSIGASTAVFGALGLLVACQTADRFRTGRKTRLWEVILPLGGGLAFLAYLGAGTETDPVDHMAHLWGFASGIVLGMAIALARLKLSPAADRLLALLAFLLPVTAWIAALADRAASSGRLW